MNQRLRPTDLDQPPYCELIDTLARQWVQADLPNQTISPPDYSRAISTLLLTTQDPVRTATIVRAILAQAAALRKTTAWVDQELKFEGMIHGADRADFLLFELHQAGQPSDAQLDLYNERIHRFGTGTSVLDSSL